MKEYVLKKTTFGGSVSTETYSSERKARSEAWRWINWQKQVVRDRNGSRDYGELRAEILRWDSNAEKSEFVELYD